MSTLTAETTHQAQPTRQQPMTPATTPRIGPLAAGRHALTLAWRSLVQIRHNPMELVDLSIQPIMFVLLFTYVFGGAIAGSTHGYLQFALAGIIVQNALFATLNTAIALNTDLTKGIYDRFRSLPIARSAPLIGRILADIVRQAWSMGILLAVGMLLGFRIGTNPLAVLAAAALLVVFCLGFSWIGVLRDRLRRGGTGGTGGTPAAYRRHAGLAHPRRAGTSGPVLRVRTADPCARGRASSGRTRRRA
jgi:hypothetical protein